MTTSSSEQIQEPGLHTLQHDCATICLLNTYDPALSIYRQASIISLAHLTSWCAERIASATLRRLCPNPDGETTAGEVKEDITPENVWDLYMSWRKFAPLGTGRMEDIEECMWRVIHDFEFVTPQETEKKLGLSRTPRPTSFPYTKLWFPSERYSHTVLPSFIPEDGTDNYRACVLQGANNAMNCFTPAERIVVTQFGPHVLPMLKKILKECMEYLELDMMGGEFNRKIFDLYQYLHTILRFGNKAIDLWCETFGTIESIGTLNIKWIKKADTEVLENGLVNEKSGRQNDGEYDQGVQQPEPKRDARYSTLGQVDGKIFKEKGRCAIQINSIPEVIKMFAIMIVTDRIHALDALRQTRRHEIGMAYVSVGDLPTGADNCPICSEPFGTLREDGESDDPVRLVCCCGQYVGERCLKMWYRKYGGACPFCRTPPTDSLIDKLFDGEPDYKMDRIFEGEYEIDNELVWDTDTDEELVSETDTDEEDAVGVTREDELEEGEVRES